MTEHRTLTANGVRLAYQSAGPPDGDPLLLLPALGETAGDWAAVRDALADRRRVYALDLRGHGRSGWTAPYSPELMRDDVLAFLDALGLDRVDLAGHSMGGVVAHLVAQRAPHRVVRLVLEDVPAPLPREAVPPVRPEGPIDYDWDMVLAVRGGLDRPDPAWLEGLGRITAPTLVIAGGPASHISQEGVAELARRIPDARMLTLPVGHLVHAAAPDAFAAAVRAFLDELPDAERARRWLAEDGITQTGHGTWLSAEPPAQTFTQEDLCNDLGSMAFTDERLDLAGRLRVALGLMDLLGSHSLVTGQLIAAHMSPEGPLPADVLWGGFRRRLEAVREYEAVTSSLWLEWFECHRTSAAAFAEVLGDDRDLLRPGAPAPLMRRARRVLEVSGPAPWSAKAATYRAAARVPALHHAVFRALLRSHHDAYGDLDHAEGLALLDTLELPPDTERLAELRTVLTAGNPAQT
ncbi:alpha/beta fold hydrolase [Streptomyces xanthophaeus]|uniref:alpha/beta fold hydrolase n=1 Tax=Streptomyces xanthophaeus TaxID=67385 RepID=UPI00341347D3